MKIVWQLLQRLSQHCTVVVFENNFFGIASERTRRENLPKLFSTVPDGSLPVLWLNMAQTMCMQS